MIGAPAARRARRRSTKRFLASIGMTFDRKTLRQMTRAADRRMHWYVRLAIALPGVALIAAWLWMFRGVMFAGGPLWRIMLLIMLIVGVPVFLITSGIRMIGDRFRQRALYQALREDFKIAVCTECGYDLRGSGGMAAKRCPECGTAFDGST